MKQRVAGFSLIEKMIVIMIIAILTVLALPNFSEWVANSRTRSVAESLQNGIRYAQAQAARLSSLTTLQSLRRQRLDGQVREGILPA